MVKRKENQPDSAESNPASNAAVEQGDIGEDNEGERVAAAPTSVYTDWSKMKINFKNPDFQHSFKSSSKNKKTWRNLKQIVSQEQSLPWPKDAIYYSSIDAPPSFRPAKKYSDISGQLANYTDPQTKLQFTDSDEFKLIRRLPSDVVAGYLTLRRANTLLQ